MEEKDNMQKEFESEDISDEVEDIGDGFKFKGTILKEYKPKEVYKLYLASDQYDSSEDDENIEKNILDPLNIKSDMERNYEYSLIKNKIELFTKINEVIGNNSANIIKGANQISELAAEQIEAIANLYQDYSTAQYFNNVKMDSRSAIYTLDTGIALNEAGNLSKNVLNIFKQVNEYASYVAQAISIAITIYEFYEKYKANQSMVISFNVTQWAINKLNLEIRHPNRPNVKMFGVRKIEKNILKKGRLQNFKDPYSAILTFIFFNFIPIINRNFEKFFQNTKAQLIDDAYDEQKYDNSKFNKRACYLCWNYKFQDLISHIAQYAEFPHLKGYFLSHDHIKILNYHIKNVESDKTDYIKNSIFALLFRTLDFAIEDLRNERFKFSDESKMALFQYALDKDNEWGARDKNFIQLNDSITHNFLCKFSANIAFQVWSSLASNKDEQYYTTEVVYIKTSLFNKFKPQVLGIFNINEPKDYIYTEAQNRIF